MRDRDTSLGMTARWNCGSAETCGTRQGVRRARHGVRLRRHIAALWGCDGEAVLLENGAGLRGDEKIHEGLRGVGIF